MFEWCDVTPAVGRVTYAYIMFNGTHLNILNDWKYNSELPVRRHCYNLFNAWTGSGAEQWEIKVYGDKRTEIRLNGDLWPLNTTGVASAVGWGPSPLDPTTNHSIFDYGHHFDCGLGCVFDIKKDPAVSCHDMAAIGVAFFPRWQRYRC